MIILTSCEVLRSVKVKGRLLFKVWHSVFFVLSEFSVHACRIDLKGSYDVSTTVIARREWRNDY